MAGLVGVGWLSVMGRGVLRGCGGVHGHGGVLEIVFFLPDVPVQCTPILFGEGCLGQQRWSIGGVFGYSLELADMWGDGQGGSRGAVRGSMVVAAEAAYAEGKAGNEAVGWAQLWSVVMLDGKGS